jgi:hypothetical protein
MAALMTGEYLEARAQRGSKKAFQRVLKQGKEPGAGARRPAVTFCSRP